MPTLILNWKKCAKVITRFAVSITAENYPAFALNLCVCVCYSDAQDRVDQWRRSTITTGQSSYDYEHLLSFGDNDSECMTKADLSI